MRYLCLPLLICAAPAVDAQAFEATQAEVAAFAAADANRDVLLDRAAFKVFVRHMAEAGQPTARQIRFFAAYGFAFSIADRNGDGRVTPEEMRSADNSHRAGTGPASNGASN